MTEVVGEIVNGLGGSNGGIVLTAFVLVGVFYLFKQSINQLKIIIFELQRTRETLIEMQQKQIHFDDRLGKVEDVVSRIKPV